MASHDPKRLHDLMDSLEKDIKNLIENDIDSMITDAQTLASEAAGFSGIISNVLKEQAIKYFVPKLQKIQEDLKTLITDTDNSVPGSINGMKAFLGSVPLAMTWAQPSLKNGDLEAEDYIPDNVKFVTPSTEGGSNPVDELPPNASFATSRPEKGPAQQESRKRPLRNSREQLRERQSRSSYTTMLFDEDTGELPITFR